MKKALCILVLFCSITKAFGQTETFGLASYSTPKGWKKEKTENAVQFTKEDAATGTYCAISLFKALPATNDAEENFNLAWSSVVQKMVPVVTQPEMQKPELENGWQILSGYAAFDKDGNKGVAILVTASSSNKMVNMIALTNTDVYEKDMMSFIESINLKKQVVEKNNEVKDIAPEHINKPQVKSSNGFTFTSTNFDDGWNSTVKEDWVEVAKGNVIILLHYPNKIADAHNFVLLDGLKNAWDVLVAPRYSSATNMQFRSSGSWESIEFGEADMIQNSTGKKVHVVLFKKNFNNGSGKYIEFITPDKATFEQAFASFESAAANYGSGAGFDKMANMVTYNKFAVSATDLKGGWTSNFSGMTQYVNAYTGANAGANTHASNESFVFGNGNSYQWDLGVASGFVGNIKFQSVKSKGTFSMLNNWQVKFSDIEGKAKTYDVKFLCIKGARVLWIGETGFGKKL